MWVTPEEIREYTDIKAVRERSDSKLRVDITRAEQYVITYTHLRILTRYRRLLKRRYLFSPRRTLIIQISLQEKLNRKLLTITAIRPKVPQ